MKKREKINLIYDLLEAEYGPQVCALEHATPLQLLVATILSAQCTDKMVNRVIVAVLCMFLGAAFVLFFKLALAVLLALFCEWLYARALGFAGERLSITALQDPALVTRVSWILAAVTTGYLCFLR